MNSLIRRTLIAAIVLFILVLILAQMLIPVAANEAAREYPEISSLVQPYSILGILALACFQVAAILLCAILARSPKPVFFSHVTRSLMLATGLLLVLGFLIPAGVAMHLLGTMNAGGFPVLFGLVVSVVAAIGFACITYLALRAFSHARTEREELEAVI